MVLIYKNELEILTKNISLALNSGEEGIVYFESMEALKLTKKLLDGKEINLTKYITLDMVEKSEISLLDQIINKGLSHIVDDSYNAEWNTVKMDVRNSLIAKGISDDSSVLIRVEDIRDNDYFYVKIKDFIVTIKDEGKIVIDKTSYNKVLEDVEASKNEIYEKYRLRFSHLVSDYTYYFENNNENTTYISEENDNDND